MPLGDRRPHSAGTHVVARAHGCVIGQVEVGHAARTGRRQVADRIGWQGAPEHGPQAGIGARIADEDAAKQGSRIIGQHELLIDPSDGIRNHHLEAIRIGAHGIPEARNIHAEKLQFGGGVRAGEGGVPAEQVVRDHFGHRVAGSHDAPAPSVDAGDFADGPHGGIVCAATRVDQHATTLTNPKIRRACQIVARAHPGGEDDDVGADLLPVSELHSCDAAALAENLRGGGRGAHADAESGDKSVQSRPAPRVDLQGHQSVRELDDGRLHRESIEGSRRLQAEQATTDHNSPRSSAGIPGPEILDELTQFGDIVDGAIDEGAVQVIAGDGWLRGIRPRRQHQGVVGVVMTIATPNQPRVPVDVSGGDASAQAHDVVFPHALIAQREILGGASAEIGRQCHAVVGRAGLFG